MQQRKIRCDSAQMPENRCSNCIAFNSECTHSAKSAPKKSAALTTPPSQLPSDVSDNNKTAQAHVAAIVLQATAYIPDSDLRRVLLDVARYARNLESALAARNRSPSVPSPSSTADSPSSLIIKDEEDLFVNALIERFDRFTLDSDRIRYFGKSSHFGLINTAMDVKKSFIEDASLPKTILPAVKRPLFWASPWELAHLSPPEAFPPLIFPQPDLLDGLVSLFFARVNIVLCLLHRPTFEKALASGLHLVDHQFGSTVLGVCAVASKYSDDPRVLLEGTNTRLSSGWKYFCQLEPFKKALMRSFTLHEAQTLCLAVFYLQGSSAPDGCWSLGGAGVRYAQEVGVHRRNRYDDRLVDEQWKRVFWILICIDTYSSTFCGRPRATSFDDYDVDYPADCDDEYWETSDPDMAFKQPPGRPSVVSYTIAYLKLMEILGMAQKMVRQKDKPREWLESIVVNLDSTLNAWIDMIPNHLRWDPNMEDPIFATQSAVLYACYYHVQIQVHRTFLVSPGPSGSEEVRCPALYNYPSLAICASSARACSHVMDVASRRGFLCDPHILSAVFDSCLIILLKVWGGRQVGIAVDPQKCLQDVEMCLRIFRTYESRWQIAGRQHDIITELMSATNMEIEYSPNPLKRGLDHDPEPSTSDSSPESDSQPVTEDEALEPGGQPFHGADASVFNMDPPLSLPMYTEDLGRLPVYEPINWGINWGQDSYDGIVLPEYLNNLAASESLFPDSTGPGTAMPSDLAAITSGVPSGYDWNDWSKYIMNVEELVQSLDNPAEGRV
ncbi:fungal-specific transcription factor domain-containing protein [Mycena rosella]|uniref:Fungal-specific transcription factor domain-containing protein n=1 Tax=Mycena rosella TaxID=1033263 RepID=A0AAD7CGZ6_MYCRO|nr:fungal-specific transcription factor domain-containing protein [Mycena rosella]